MHRKTTSVSVRCQSSTDANVIGTGLLLGETPLPRRTLLALKVSPDKLGPKCSRMHLYQSALRIEADDLVEPRHIDQDHVSAKLLTSHRMTAARYGQRLPGGLRCSHSGLETADAFRLQDAVDMCGIELRMNVIDEQG